MARHADVLTLIYPLKDVAGDFETDLSVDGAHFDAVQDEIPCLLSEMHPDTCTETIADWETRYGIIPPPGADLAARRLAASQKRRMRGRLDVQYFIDLAAVVGYTIDIEELPPNAAAYGGTPSTIHIFRVHVSGGQKQITNFTAGDSSAGDLLTDWQGEDILENIINKLKPGHTRVIFIYE